MDKKLYDLFDLGAAREGTGCEKWDGREHVFGRADVLPLWVADMDFKSPEAVISALTQRAAHGVYGYAAGRDETNRAVVNWLKNRHGLDARAEWITYSPGVVSSLLFALRAVTRPGDKVALQPPVYGPFYQMAERAGLQIFRNPLVWTQAGWRMNLDQLEDGLKSGVKAIMLCSPHNPVGRVWTRDELGAVCALAGRYGAHIISDEIHMDFEMPGYRHSPILTIPGGERAIMLCSATKTFNLAGLNTSSIVIADEQLRGQVRRVMEQSGVGGNNIFGEIAQTAAYESGGPWLDALIDYLDGTRALCESFIAQRLPELTLTRAEGTYLLWLDMRALHMEQDRLMCFLVEKAGLGLSDGVFFGPEGKGYVRVNIATPRRNVRRALEMLSGAIRAL